jgi:uncharacterized membrane protein
MLAISAASSTLLPLVRCSSVANSYFFFTFPPVTRWETEVPTIMFFLLAICALIFTMARLQTLKGALQYRRAILFRMLLYVIAFAVCWSGETVLSIYLTIVRIDSVDKKTFLALFWWAAVSSCLLGLANAIVWLTTPTFYRAARQANCCSKRKKQRNADHESLLVRQPHSLTALFSMHKNLPTYFCYFAAPRRI